MQKRLAMEKKTEDLEFETVSEWHTRAQLQFHAQWDIADQLMACARKALQEFELDPQSVNLTQIARSIEIATKLSHLAVERARAAQESSSSDFNSLRQELEMLLTHIPIQPASSYASASVNQQPLAQ